MYSMRLLFITQSVDERDTVLGFVCGWLREFANEFSDISVVCLRKGVFSLPENVKVFSINNTKCCGLQTLGVVGKALIFLRFVWRTRNDYDAVFVHMNQEYILLAGVLWKILGKKVALWYNHTSGNFLTRTAMMLADVVFHTSPYAFTAGTKKSVRMPAGIDVERFSQVAGVVRAPKSILYLGRIAPVKGVKTLIEASLILQQRGVDFSITICGDALPRDSEYEKILRQLAEPLVVSGKCRFIAGVPNSEAPSVFSIHKIFVNLTPAGNYDKTVLEAAACGTIPIVSSPAFRDAFPTELFFEEKNPQSLADKIEKIFTLREDEQLEISNRLRKYVEEKHNLKILPKRIYENLLHC